MIEKPECRRHFSLACGSFLLLLVMLTGYGCSSEAQPENTPARGGQAPIPVSAIEIQARDLHRTLSVTAIIEPRHRVRVGSRIAGLVESVHVSEGQEVAAGDVLATLDMSELRAELVRARAEESSARLAFERATALHARGVQSIAQLDSARVALEVAESELALVRTRLSFGSVVSPINAVLSGRMVEPGESVQAHAALFELVSQQDLVLRVGVSELDVVHIRQGDIMPVWIDALPSLRLEGKVSRVFPAADASTRLTTVEISLPSEAAEKGVRVGFLARVRTPVDLKPAVLAVPVAALGHDSGGHYVFAIDDGVLHRTAVIPGTTYAEWVEIQSGLNPGMRVLASNPVGMRSGQAVRVVAPRGV